jgi:transcriptional regulator with XRE-family HTH domain
MTLDSVGRRLRRHREAAGLTAEMVAREIGVSRALLYRYESGDIVKIAVLERLARIYGTSTTALLGLGSEYLTSGLKFFERIQAIEETADHTTVVFGPIAYLLTSDAYDVDLEQALAEPTDQEEALNGAELQVLLRTLKRRKATFRSHKPSIVNIVPIAQIVHYLANGLTLRTDLSYAERSARRRAAARQMEHLASLIASPPMGVQIGITRRPLPTAGFQLIRAANRKLLVLSPFRLIQQPNLRYGVAMITEDEEALRLHEMLTARLWESALTGSKAIDEINRQLKNHRG